MNGFFISKRKTFELIALIVFDLFAFLLWNSWDFVVLFTFGYIWNWVASQETSIALLETRKYRFSTLKTVFNLQRLFLKPVNSLPEAVKFVVRCLPAGIFWTMVIVFNESQMPWWSVFLGSLSLELIQLEKKLFKSKESTL